MKFFISESAVTIGLIIFLCYPQESKIEPIDYGKLKVMKTATIMEIDGSDEYVFGKLGDLVVKPDGMLLISDLGKTTIEQFGPEGNHVATIARSGKGPGELPSYFSLIDAGTGRFIVWHEEARQIDYFARRKDGIYSYKESTAGDQPGNQRMDLIGPISETKFYALTGLPDIALIKADLPDYRQSPVAIVDKSLTILQDSLYMLKTPNHLFGDPSRYVVRITMNGLVYLGMPPYRSQDRFVLMENGYYMIARPDSATLLIYNSNHERTKRITLHVKSRPIQKADLDYGLSRSVINSDPRIRNELKAHVKKFKPVFLNIWVSKNYIWLHTDTGEKGKQVVIFTREGEPIGKFYLSEYDDIRYFRNSRIYTLHKNPEKGHSIRIYQVDIL